MKLKSFMDATPEAYLVGFKFTLGLLKIKIISWMLMIWSINFGDLHILNKDLHVATNTKLKDFIDQPLICHPCIFEAERHELVGRCAQSMMNDASISSSSTIIIMLLLDE